ncbi:hypothetical protein Poly24_34810 [Rosistilla carotiformis]|uniref:Uncharacterized protein n=1 Tax=Rosistilla carotiformis TaxID=2528017 RepID=A0A518JW47_9BACT|nr:hypothetical protein Poly24_34810 [Rosistilla carotiformis]
MIIVIAVVVVVAIIGSDFLGQIALDNVVVNDFIQFRGLREHLVGDVSIEGDFAVQLRFFDGRIVGDEGQFVVFTGSDVVGGCGKIAVDSRDVDCQSFTIGQFGSHDRFDFDFVEHLSQQGFGFFDRRIDLVQRCDVGVQVRIGHFKSGVD